jgi:transposase
MRVLHGARYSPHDNPVERIWATLKAWPANTPTLTIQGRLRQVHTLLPAAHQRAAPDYRRATQLTLAA